jgi:ATP-dependent RNA helicase DDX3X
MDTFVTDMGSALKDVPVNHNNRDPAAANAAREKGWVEPEQYDYAKYTAGPPLPKIEEEGSFEAAGEPQDVPEWAHKAAKYEWKDEYGDVGPEIPELEEELFRSDFINRQGLKLNK